MYREKIYCQLWFLFANMYWDVKRKHTHTTIKVYQTETLNITYIVLFFFVSVFVRPDWTIPEFCPFFWNSDISIYRKFVSQTPSTVFKLSKWNFDVFICLFSVKKRWLREFSSQLVIALVSVYIISFQEPIESVSFSRQNVDLKDLWHLVHSITGQNSEVRAA